MFSGRYAAKEFNAKHEHVGPGPWLEVIRTANELAHARNEDELFGEPDRTGDWWAGGYVEEYPEARVLHRDEDAEGEATTVSIIALSDRAAEILTIADKVVEAF